LRARARSGLLRRVWFALIEFQFGLIDMIFRF
jgi:hypothetical protein